MKCFVFFLTLFTGTIAWAQDPANNSATSSPRAPLAPIPGKWNAAKVPWDQWFKIKKTSSSERKDYNTTIEDKTSYIYFFWDAQDYKANFEVRDKETRLADAALQLVSRLYPPQAKADLIKVDIVYFLEKDTYGDPTDDSIQRVAHFELSKKKIAKITNTDSLSNAAFQNIFNKFEVY
jgi:hypothetical protein